MNVGYENKELESYKEPEQDFNDLKRIGQKHTDCSFFLSLSVYLHQQHVSMITLAFSS